MKGNKEFRKNGETAAKRAEAGKIKAVARVRERRGESQRWNRNIFF